jgi:mRNA-degrading endonuclease RelE of RelBE toxin-antitoxin system
VPLKLRILGTPKKYFESLDRDTRSRVLAKLSDIAKDPLDTRLSKPLRGSDKRGSRVGKYRIIFEFDSENLTVTDLGPRGQVYRNI